MPNLDGTGPDGRGGWCTPLWRSGQSQRLVGRGLGRGAARGGRGFRNRYYATGQPFWASGVQSPSVRDDTKSEVESLKKQLEDAKRRLEELEGKK